MGLNICQKLQMFHVSRSLCLILLSLSTLHYLPPLISVYPSVHSIHTEPKRNRSENFLCSNQPKPHFPKSSFSTSVFYGKTWISLRKSIYQNEKKVSANKLLEQNMRWSAVPRWVGGWVGGRLGGWVRNSEPQIKAFIDIEYVHQQPIRDHIHREPLQNEVGVALECETEYHRTQAGNTKVRKPEKKRKKDRIHCISGSQSSHHLKFKTKVSMPLLMGNCQQIIERRKRNVHPHQGLKYQHLQVQKVDPLKNSKFNYYKTKRNIPVKVSVDVLCSRL